MEIKHYVPTKPTYLVEAIHLYLEYKTDLISKTTNESIKSTSNIMLRTIPKMGIENATLEQSNTGLMSDLLARMKKDRQVSNKRYNTYRAFLKNCFDYFYDKEWVSRNPIISIPKQKKEATKYHKPFNDNEIARIYEYLRENNTFLLLFIDIFRYSGLRPKEIKELTVGCIDTVKWTITATHTKTKVKRVISIPIDCIDTFKSLNVDSYPKSYYLFSNRYKGVGSKMSGKNAFNMAFKKVKDSLGLDKYHTLYGFRATTALQIYEANEFNPQVVQEYLGHTNGESTYNYLSRPEARSLRKTKLIFPKLQQ